MIDAASNDPGGSACTRISGMHKVEVIGNILARLSWTDSDPRVRLRLITWFDEVDWNASRQVRGFVGGGVVAGVIATKIS